VNQDDANRVFAMIAEIHGDLRSRLIVSRWWLIWAAMGCLTLAAASASQWTTRILPGAIAPHVAIWSAEIAVTLLTIRVLHRRSGGQRTAKERALWTIWLSFIVAASTLPLLERALELSPFKLLPAASLLATFCCVLTATLVHWSFFLGIAVFTASTIAMARMPTFSFLIYGIAWFCFLELLALVFRPRSPIATRPL